MRELKRNWFPYSVTLAGALAVLLMILFWARPGHATTTTLTGTIKDAFQNPVNGTLVLQLPVPAQDTSTNTLVANSPISCRVINGSLSGCPPVFDVAGLQPQNLYYIASVYDSSGVKVLGGNFVITGFSFNLGAASPTNVTTSNISFINPASLTLSQTFTGSNAFTQPILESVATGTAPFVVNSTTLVPNLNINNLNGVTVTGVPSNGAILQATSSSAALWASPSGLQSFYTNSGSGTTVNLIAKLVGIPSTVQTVTTSDTGGAVGICVVNCTNTGTAGITTTGQASCLFDGATLAGDYVQISSTIAGNCHDSGSGNYPSSGQILGRVLSSNGAGGTFNMTLFGTEIRGATPSVSGQVFGQSTTYDNTAIAGTTVTAILHKLVTMPSSGCPCRALVSYSSAYTVASQQTVQTWITDSVNTFGIAQAGINAANLTNMGLTTSDISPVTYGNGSATTFTVNVEATAAITMVAPNFTGGPYIRVLILTSN